MSHTLLNSRLELDLDFVRQQFPAFSQPHLQGQAFFENAGGSYACKQTIELLTRYYIETKVQPYHLYPTAEKAGAAMDASYLSFANYLNVTSDEIYFGPSTSQNTYVLAQAIKGYLKAGDEIIVTNQDHEANSGVWRRLSQHGVIIKEWQVDPSSGSLHKEALAELINDKTKLLVFPHCSNIVGEINPVSEICTMAHAVGAITVVDGVSYAGHNFPDVAALGADVYLFSLYKTYGPHQGLMVVRKAVAQHFSNQGHYFNADDPHKRLVPAGPDHAQVAAAKGVTDYFDSLYTHHTKQNATSTASPQEKAQKVRQLLTGSEQARLKPFMDYLSSNSKIRIVGPSTLTQRAPTVSITAQGHEPATLVTKLAKYGIMSGHGHFYAARLLEAMGIDLEGGVVRFSFVHYTSDAEVQQLIAALEQSI